MSAAISLKEAFLEIGRQYKTETGIEVRFNFGATGILQKQIEAGGPADVFASAGERQMDELQAKELIAPETRQEFARNSLVMIVASAAVQGPGSFEELASPTTLRVAIGNPKTVPAGQYTRQALVALDLWQALEPKLVLAEDVRQVLDYVARQEVDAGIVYVSDARIAQDRVTVKATSPEQVHDPIRYPVAVIRESRHKEEAQRFIALLLGDKGQAVMVEFGFMSAR